MRWINEIRGKVVCLLLHSSEYCRQLIYDKLCTLKHGHSHFKQAQIPKSESVRENRPRRSRRPWPTFAWEEMSHHPRGKWFSRALGAYRRTSTNGRISTTATSLHWLLFCIPAESPLNVMLTGRFATTIFSAIQRCNIVATLFRIVTKLIKHCNAVLR